MDHILPLPENMQIKSDVNKALGGGGRGHGGRVAAAVEEEEVVGTAVAVVDVVEGAGQETEVSSLF